jgi:hypothetical protein
MGLSNHKRNIETSKFTHTSRVSKQEKKNIQKVCVAHKYFLTVPELQRHINQLEKLTWWENFVADEEEEVETKISANSENNSPSVHGENVNEWEFPQ